MRARQEKTASADSGERRDYLFLWKEVAREPYRGWPHDKLRKLVDKFDSHGVAEESVAV